MKDLMASSTLCISVWVLKQGPLGRSFSTPITGRGKDILDAAGQVPFTGYSKMALGRAFFTACRAKVPPVAMATWTPYLLDRAKRSPTPQRPHW